MHLMLGGESFHCSEITYKKISHFIPLNILMMAMIGNVLRKMREM